MVHCTQVTEHTGAVLAQCRPRSLQVHLYTLYIAHVYYTSTLHSPNKSRLQVPTSSVTANSNPKRPQWLWLPVTLVGCLQL